MYTDLVAQGVTTERIGHWDCGGESLIWRICLLSFILKSPRSFNLNRSFNHWVFYNDFSRATSSEAIFPSKSLFFSVGHTQHDVTCCVGHVFCFVLGENSASAPQMTLSFTSLVLFYASEEPDLHMGSEKRRVKCALASKIEKAWNCDYETD